MPSTIITAFLVVSIVSVHCLPIDRKASNSSLTAVTADRQCPDDSSIVVMSEALLDNLTNNDNDNSEGLYRVYLLADSLTKDELFKPEVYS